MRNALDLRIPPPLVGLAAALLAWLAARTAPALAVHWQGLHALAVVCVLIGLSLDAWALLVFRQGRTTVNPLLPDRTVRVVRHGPYRFTRNPMYLGMACMLVGLSLWLGNPLALAGPLLFIAYLTCFQIIPEERILLKKFGPSYADYTRLVRRWL